MLKPFHGENDQSTASQPRRSMPPSDDQVPMDCPECSIVPQDRLCGAVTVARYLYLKR
jgi:hypothetical protein